MDSKAKQWHTLVAGQPKGTYKIAEIKEMIKKGELSAEDYLWNDALTDWKKVSDIPGLLQTNQNEKKLYKTTETHSKKGKRSIIGIAMILVGVIGFILISNNDNNIFDSGIVSGNIDSEEVIATGDYQGIMQWDKRLLEAQGQTNVEPMPFSMRISKTGNNYSVSNFQYEGNSYTARDYISFAADGLKFVIDVSDDGYISFTGDFEVLTSDTISGDWKLHLRNESGNYSSSGYGGTFSAIKR